jgi:succinyl-diaminopimelate desuccinylase
MKTPPEVISVTRELLTFNTINPPGMERACARYLGGLLENGGYQVGYFDYDEGRTNLVAIRRGSGKKGSLCFSGHIDTVPLGAVRWNADPFAGEIKEGKIYGRGASDMKAGVAAMVVAALRAAKINKAEAGVTLVITAGEETGCQGASHLANHSALPGNAGALIVGEPTSNYPLVGHKGALWIEARTAGITAHGSMPELGDNAIYKAARIVTKLQTHDFRTAPHPLLGAPSLNVGMISGGMSINSVADQATIGIDIRTTPYKANREVYEELRSSLGKEAELSQLLSTEPVATDPEHDWVQEVYGIMEPFLGEQPVPRVAPYFTDASILTPFFGGAPTIVLGPGEPSMAHTTDEFCYIARIEEAVEAYFEIARKWCKL